MLNSFEELCITQNVLTLERKRLLNIKYRILSRVYKCSKNWRIPEREFVNESDYEMISIFLKHHIYIYIYIMMKNKITTL